MEPVADLERFFDAAEQLVGDRGPKPATFARIGDLLRILASRSSLDRPDQTRCVTPVERAGDHLGRGPKGSTLMLGRFTAEAPTPVHNHNSWGVLCVIRGRDRHILWMRQDDGARPGQAQLRIIETRELDPGDLAWFPDPPGDIHSQQGIGEAAWELVYFGRDPMALPRLYFDPERGRVDHRAAV